jgi:hypothetical protein
MCIYDAIHTAPITKRGLNDNRILIGIEGSQADVMWDNAYFM